MCDCFDCKHCVNDHKYGLRHHYVCDVHNFAEIPDYFCLPVFDGHCTFNCTLFESDKKEIKIDDSKK